MLIHTPKYLKLVESIDFDVAHALVVRKLALQLFDELQPIHGLDRIERRWLGIAALLHDVGKAKDTKKHHKRSRDFILTKTARIVPDKANRVIVALVARYHRGALTYKRHRYYSNLTASAKRIVDKLASLLRLADALDKGHTGTTKGLRCRIKEPFVRITVKCRHKLRQRIIRKKSELLKKVFDTPLKICRQAA